MVYGRGSTDDFNLYASISGDPGWNWDNMFKYALKVCELSAWGSLSLTFLKFLQTEKLVPPADGHDTTGEFDPSLHSTTGAVDVSLYGYPSPIESRVIATTHEMPDLFPFTNDTIGGDVVGIGKT